MEKWMSQTFWLYDLTVLAILILCVWGGWKRGLLRTIIGLAGYGLAALLSGFLAQPVSQWAYEKWVEQPCTQLLEQQLEKYDFAGTVRSALSSYGVSLDAAQLQQIAQQPEHAADALCSAAAAQTGLPAEVIQQGLHQSLDSAAVSSYTRLPDWMTESLLPSDSGTEAAENRLAQTAAVLLTEDNAAAAQTLTELYVKPALLSMVKIFTFSALFLLISVALQVIIKGISYLCRSQSMVFWNQAAGAGIGCFQAVVFLFLMGKLTQWLTENSQGQIPFFRTADIEKTVLFQGIYQIVTGLHG